MTDAFIIQTIQKPSGHSSGRHLSPPTSAVGNPAPPEYPPSAPPPARGTRGQSSDSENTAPHSWTCYSQPLPARSSQDRRSRDTVENTPFPVSFASRPEHYRFDRFTKHLQSQELEEIYTQTFKKEKKQSFLPEVLFPYILVDSNLFQFHLF